MDIIRRELLKSVLGGFAIKAAAPTQALPAENSISAGFVGSVENRDELAALSPAVTSHADLAEPDLVGQFDFVKGDFSKRLDADIGRARFVHSSHVSPSLGAWVRRTDKALTPSAFGAKSSANKSASSALNSFFEVLTNENIPDAVWEGEYVIDQPIQFGTDNQTIATKSVKGRLNLTAAPETSGTAMMTVKNGRGLLLDSVELRGAGDKYALSRRDKWCMGLVFWNTSSSLLNNFKAQYFYGYAYSQAGGAQIATNNNDNTINVIRAFDCGSGYYKFDFVGNQSGIFQNPVHQGTSGSHLQTTTVEVSVMPPPVLNDWPAGRPPMLAVINERAYFITNCDYERQTIEIFPWLDLSLTTGRFIYIFGGAVHTQGGDSGLFKSSMIIAQRCGYALQDGALYGVVCDRLQTEACGIAYARGMEPKAAAVGGLVTGYFESNLWDVAQFTRKHSASSYSIVNSEYALNLGKCFNICEPRNADNQMAGIYNMIDAIVLSRHGRSLVCEGAAHNGDSGNKVISIDMNWRGAKKIIKHISPVIAIIPPDVGMNRAFGVDSTEFTIVGTSPTGKPDLIQINVPIEPILEFKIDIATSQCQVPLNNLQTGHRVRLSSTLGLPQALGEARDYFVIVDTPTKLRLAESMSEAKINQHIVIDSLGFGSHSIKPIVTLNGLEDKLVINDLPQGPANFVVYHDVRENNYSVYRS